MSLLERMLGNIEEVKEKAVVSKLLPAGVNQVMFYDYKIKKWNDTCIFELIFTGKDPVEIEHPETGNRQRASITFWGNAAALKEEDKNKLSKNYEKFICSLFSADIIRKNENEFYSISDLKNAMTKVVSSYEATDPLVDEQTMWGNVLTLLAKDKPFYTVINQYRDKHDYLKSSFFGSKSIKFSSVEEKDNLERFVESYGLEKLQAKAPQIIEENVESTTDDDMPW